MYHLENILFIDLEVTAKGRIGEIGLVVGEQSLRTDSLQEAGAFIKKQSANLRFLCGHNLIDFDDRYLTQSSLAPLLDDLTRIDTLAISTLFFSEKTFHKLPKAYKSEDDFKNNPLKDALLTRTLLENSFEKFLSLPIHLQNSLYTLTRHEKKFAGFYDLLPQKPEALQPKLLQKILIRLYEDLITDESALKEAITKEPVALAYIVALMTPTIEIKAHPPRILHEYPQIVALHKQLTLSKEPENLTEFSAQTFGFAAFREFPRLDPALGESPTLSQREIVEAALQEESFIAVLPTGGGKTFSFWLPALYRAKRTKSLTVVISPLQALMRDQIESFNRQVANFSAVAISGFQNALERSDAIEKVINGEADILYLAPESLRSETIFKLLKNRLIDRFVIDEAHCLSTWGHDFRHDYFFIAEFIADLLKAQPWQDHLPVSCFTATAKPDVIEDIARYFGERLGLTMARYLARPERTNLTYTAHAVDKEEEKYLKLLEILNSRQGPALIYIPSSTRKCDEIAEKLAADVAPRRVAAFHAKLESEQKAEILQGYLDGSIDVIVATTAFGMGVDKPDIHTVIHYEISNSLENYAQEAGRGARDKSLEALCPILFDEKDLDKHFAQLNRTKLNADEVNAVFRVLKKQKGDKVLLTAREIAEAAGWDTEGEDQNWEIKVKTALLELEREGYLARKRNKVRYFADAVAKDAFEKLETLKQNGTLSPERHDELTRVLAALLGRGKPSAFQIDEAVLTLNMPRERIGKAILELKEYGILSDAKEMTLTIRPDAFKRLQTIQTVEKALLQHFLSAPVGSVTIRALNETLIESNVLDKNANATRTIKTLLTLWRAKKGHFFFRRTDQKRDLWYYEVRDGEGLKRAVELKHALFETILTHFLAQLPKSRSKEGVTLAFSVLALAKTVGYEARLVDRALLHLHRLGLLELGEGRFIYYAPMQIVKTDKFDQKKRYTKAEYAKRLKAYYTRKIEAIHIMGEYAKRLRQDPAGAKAFLGHYFTLPYDRFKRKYKLLKEQITRPMTQKRYERIFSALSPAQKEIIEDNTHDAILVLAGPGSGKTKTLVHKIASLILKEDVKPEQFLMLTFSHAAVSEFRARLHELIGTLANEVEIRTFHGFSLSLIGRRVSDESDALLQNAVAAATRQIREGVVCPPAKSVLMLDEFQDINADAFALIEALYDAQDGAMRHIAVGDDDQCILQSVNGADVRFFDRFIETFGQGEGGYARYTLLHNYRSTRPIVRTAAILLDLLSDRIKEDRPKPVKEKGAKVEVVEVAKGDLVTAATNRFEPLAQEDGSCAFLAFSNQEVALLYSQLFSQGFRPVYLTERAGYRLKNLAELRHFSLALRAIAGDDPIFDKAQIVRAKAAVAREFPDSKRLDTLDRVIQTFTRSFETFYFSLWEEFLEEIGFEEFEGFGKLLLSTMHKSKGKEFDRVIVVIPSKPHTDEWIRLLYVAMTRAKNHLHIVTNDKDLLKILQKANSFFSKTLTLHTDLTPYPPPNAYTHIMSLKDVALGISYYSGLPPKQRPVAGSTLTLDTSSEPYRLFFHNRPVEKLSKACTQKLKTFLEKGWQCKEIEVDATVYWFDKERKEVFPHLLGKIILQTQHTNA